jgi:hypothetical protein
MPAFWEASAAQVVSRGLVPSSPVQAPVVAPAQIVVAVLTEVHPVGKL